MARIASGKSMKSEKPVWYCLPHPFGSIFDLVQTGKKLQYVTERNYIARVWRNLGNPKFRFEYSYLLISVNSELGRLSEVFAVKATNPSEKKQPGFLNMPAFEGQVDSIEFGWASRAHVKCMIEHGVSPDGEDMDSSASSSRF